MPPTRRAPKERPDDGPDTVRAKKVTVTRLELDINSETAELICEAIGAAGDEGMDPFTIRQRTILKELTTMIRDELDFGGK